MNFGEFAKEFQGRILRGRSELEPFERDFSLALRRRPFCVAVAATSDDIAATFSFAQEHALPVTIRAGGHSGGGQTLTESVVVVPPQPPNPVRRIENGVVELEASGRWCDVQQRLAQQGLSAPVLPAWLATTVGGTVSVGGYGVRSIARGNQLDHVERFRLLRFNGSAVWCSRTMNPDLFMLAPATLGQLGLIDRVVLRTEVASLTRLHRQQFATFSALASWLRHVPPVDVFFAFAARSDYLLGRISAHLGVDDNTSGVPGSSAEADAARPIDLTLDADVRQWLAQFPHHSRLFTDLIVDHDGLVALASWLDVITPKADDLQGVYILVARNRSGFPFDGRFGEASFLYGVGLYTLPPHNDPRRRRGVEILLEQAVTLCREAGGRPYLWGWHGLEEGEVELVYGTAFDRLRKTRLTADPLDLLNRGSLGHRQC